MNNLSSGDIAFTTKLDEVILRNLENEHFGVKELAHEIGMSRFNLNRKLRFICRKTINQYIRETRLERAMVMLQQEPLTASEASFKVGFSSPAYFSTCFSEYYGYPPGEVKKRGTVNPGQNREEPSPEPLAVKPGFLKHGMRLVKPPMPGRWTISVVSFLIVLMIGILYFFNIQIPVNFNFIRSHQADKHKRSIAVLPFINDSHDPDNEYFINGVMEAILDDLSKINDMEVHPRTSVEQYRNNSTKTIPQIGRELGVNYIIEGSGQKIGNQVSLYIQLIEASSDKHLFSIRYNQKLEDIFKLQSEVALKVAAEIDAAITFEERELIEKKPTANFAALNLFLQANDVHAIAESESDHELDLKAERLYRRAIELDSAYADPYASLGWIIIKRNVDSALYFANRALHFDAKNPQAYTLKGYAYYYLGMEREAEEAYKLSIKYQPNNSTAFRCLGELYFSQGNCYSAIENQLQAFHLENNLMQEQHNLESFCSSLYALGFYSEGKNYATKLLELHNDSSFYYWGTVSADLDVGNTKAAIKKAMKIYEFDTLNPNNIELLFGICLFDRNFIKADQLLQRYLAIKKQQGVKVEPNYLFGFSYFKNGIKDEADFHFDNNIKEALIAIEHDQPSFTCRAYIVLAKIYSVRNEKEKALEYLKKVTECMGLTIFAVKDYEYCPMFDNIRQEPGFREYLQQAEAKYRREHEKVEKLLREEGILISSL